MTGEATDAQKASFLTALAIKGETIEEITEAAVVMRSHCAPFDNDMDTLEIVGTGGDKIQHDEDFYTGSIDHECSRHQDNQTWSPRKPPVMWNSRLPRGAWRKD